MDLETRRRLHARRWSIMARYRADAQHRPDAEWVARLTDADARALLLVFEALRRLDAGTYGRCVGCGAAIDDAALEARPEAALCAVCAMFSAVESPPA
jgi:RNA polymerase-binding transcription factor DksA